MNRAAFGRLGGEQSNLLRALMLILLISENRFDFALAQIGGAAVA